MAVSSFSLILCVVVGAVFANRHASEYTENESDLRMRLFENYDKLARPVRNTTEVVTVQVGLAPLRVKDVDVKDKTVKLDTWLYLKWHDDKLTWNPRENSGLDSLSLFASEVWRPDIALYTATPDNALFPSVMTNVVIYHNGTVLWVPPYSFKSRCPPSEGQVTEDTFQCTLEVGSWTYASRRVAVVEREHDVLQGTAGETYHDTDEKWNLESMTARSEQKMYSCCPETYSLIKYNLLFKKKHSDGE